MATIHVTGRRWFSKHYGNTYNTVYIYVDGVLTVLPMEYGYGEYYLQRAEKWLVDNGVIKPDTSHLRIMCANQGHTFSYDCVDVARQKDL